ncbi:hypothetical protein A11S_1925 [Micavibrio aeruginosavorus EPB]|uniref:Uncharacterized protein n=1 Tax=Micavibrio aeruginosavorus EPB TaxID=349215 RepID=M4VKU5_9BACT|nr:hypothetical protein A11S_1925 [Micavibrio aeruginosavorus EPB]
MRQQRGAVPRRRENIHQHILLPVPGPYAGPLFRTSENYVKSQEMAT